MVGIYRMSHNKIYTLSLRTKCISDFIFRTQQHSKQTAIPVSAHRQICSIHGPCKELGDRWHRAVPGSRRCGHI